MNPLDALRKAIDNFPGGRPVVAVRLGYTDEGFRKQLSGSSPNHKLGLLDAIEASEMCIDAQSAHCYAFVNAVNGTAGRLLELPVRDMASKEDARTDMAGLLKECSDAFQALTNALADDSISDNERRVCEKELAEIVEKVQDINRGVRAINEAGKPGLRVA